MEADESKVHSTADLPHVSFVFLTMNRDNGKLCIFQISVPFLSYLQTCTLVRLQLACLATVMVREFAMWCSYFISHDLKEIKVVQLL